MTIEAARRALETAMPFTVPAKGPCVLTVADLLARDFPPRDYLLRPVLPVKGLAMLYARRGAGKTWAALSLAYAVASGGKFLRWAADRPKRVLYVDGEMPGATLKDRLASIVAGSETEPPDPSFLRFLAADLQPADEPLQNLSTQDGQAQIAAMAGDAELIILDNVSTLASFGRENESESWGPLQEWLLRMRREGRAVLLVHHAGKDGRQRGTSKREDVLDTVIALRQPEDYEPSQGARFEIHLEKARGLAGSAADPFEASLTMTGQAVAWTVADLEDVKLTEILDMKREGSSVRDIAKAVGLSKSAVQRALAKVR